MALAVDTKGLKLSNRAIVFRKNYILNCPDISFFSSKTLNNEENGGGEIHLSKADYDDRYYDGDYDHFNQNDQSETNHISTNIKNTMERSVLSSKKVWNDQEWMFYDAAKN